MLADPTLLQQPSQDAVPFDRQAFRNAARRGVVLSALSVAPEETDRGFLLEYAFFLLEQEARYCQQ